MNCCFVYVDVVVVVDDDDGDDDDDDDENYKEFPHHVKLM